MGHLGQLSIAMLKPSVAKLRVTETLIVEIGVRIIA